MAEFKNDKSPLSGKGEGGEWKTVNGAHIFIEDGQSIESAMEEKFNKGKSEGKKPKSARDELKEVNTEIEKIEKGLGKKEYSKRYEFSHDTSSNEKILNNANFPTVNKLRELKIKKESLLKKAEQEFLDEIRRKKDGNAGN